MITLLFIFSSWPRAAAVAKESHVDSLVDAVVLQRADHLEARAVTSPGLPVFLESLDRASNLKNPAGPGGPYLDIEPKRRLKCLSPVPDTRHF